MYTNKFRIWLWYHKFTWSKYVYIIHNLLKMIVPWLGSYIGNKYWWPQSWYTLTWFWKSRLLNVGHRHMCCMQSITITGLILGLRTANERALLYNNVSHWLGANLESALNNIHHWWSTVYYISKTICTQFPCAFFLLRLHYQSPEIHVIPLTIFFRFVSLSLHQYQWSKPEGYGEWVKSITHKT